MDNISAQEQADIKQIAAIKAEIENRMINFDYSNNVTEKLFCYLPFIISTLMGYKMDVAMDDLPDLVNLYVLIWIFYRDKKMYVKYRSQKNNTPGRKHGLYRC